MIQSKCIIMVVVQVYYAVVEVLEIRKEAAGEEDPLLWTDQVRHRRRDSSSSSRTFMILP